MPTKKDNILEFNQHLKIKCDTLFILTLNL